MKEIYEKIKLDLNINFKKLKLKIDDDIIHQIRVDFKKLKAYYKLFEFKNVDFKFKDSFLINKEFYSILGEYRDITILQKYINEFNILLENENENENYDYSLKYFIETYYDILVENYIDIDDYVDEYIIYLHDSVNLDTNNEKELHNQRKIIKDYYYFSNWLNLDNKEYLKEISNLLGEWHDKKNILEKIKDMNVSNVFKENLKKDSEFFLQESRKKWDLYNGA